MRKKTGLYILVFLAIILAAAVAYSLPRLLSGQNLGLAGLIPGLAGPSNGGSHLDVSFIPAPQLPNRPPDTVGSIAEVKDNSIFVTPRNGGAPYEVVVTQGTQIWQDTNENLPAKSSELSGSVRVQETVKAIPISQVSLNVDGLFWGEQRGTRWIASVVLVRGGK